MCVLYGRTRTWNHWENQGPFYPLYLVSLHVGRYHGREKAEVPKLLKCSHAIHWSRLSHHFSVSCRTNHLFWRRQWSSTGSSLPTRWHIPASRDRHIAAPFYSPWLLLPVSRLHGQAQNVRLLAENLYLRHMPMISTARFMIAAYVTGTRYMKEKRQHKLFFPDRPLNRLVCTYMDLLLRLDRLIDFSSS